MKELADRSGVSHQEISRLESGQRDPTLKMIIKLRRGVHFSKRTLLRLFDDCDQIACTLACWCLVLGGCPYG